MIRYFLIGVLFPLLIQFIMYYRFTPNYQPGIYSESGFRSFYESSVFKYRIAGKTLDLWIYHKLKSSESFRNFKENKIYEKRLLALDPEADSLFYLTYYIINGFFSVLLSLGLLYLYDRPGLYTMSESEKIFSTVLLILVVAITQFVITPYDVAAYSSEVFSFTTFLIYLRTNKWKYLLFTCILIGIATLIRESSALILSLMGAVYLSLFGFSFSWVKKMIFPCLSFIITYIGLRWYVNSASVQISENNKLVENLTFRPSALMGIGMAVIIFYLIRKAAEGMNKKLLYHFLLLSVPYVVMVIFAGLLVELRLWLPIIVGACVLYKINLQKLGYNKQFSDLSAHHTTDPQPH